MNKETVLQNEIIVRLCENGCHAWNHTVGVFLTKYGGTVRIGNHGEADIWGFRHADGKMFFIEVKLPGEKPRKDQRKFLETMQKAGAIAGVAHSIDEALEIVKC